MVVLSGTRIYFIIIGVLELALSVMFVICSKTVIQKYSHGGEMEWYSLFYLFHAIPGTLCILSGASSTPERYAKASIGFHIISAVASTIGAAVTSVFWQMYKDPNACVDNNTTEECVCFSKTYAMSCSDGEVSRILLAVLTAANIFMIMTSFLGSILACTNVCCDPMQSNNEQRSSRIDTSHSEQMVLSNGTLSGYETSVHLHSIQANVKHRNHNTPSSETKQPAASETKQPAASETKQPASETKQPASETKQPASETKQPASETKQPASETKQPASETKQPASETKQPASETKQPASNSEENYV